MNRKRIVRVVVKGIIPVLIFVLGIVFFLGQGNQKKNDEVVSSSQDEMTSTQKDNAEEDFILTDQYSYLDEKRMPPIKDQGKYGTCWAFATLAAIESTLLPEEKFDFSENNLIHNNMLSEEIQDGGDYIMSMAYLMAWKGPVLEKDDPYGNSETDMTIKAVKHVQEAQIIPAKDYRQIKEMVYRYGGVESSIYMSMNDSSSKSINYNEEEYAYCYKGEKNQIMMW